MLPSNFSWASNALTLPWSSSCTWLGGVGSTAGWMLYLGRLRSCRPSHREELSGGHDSTGSLWVPGQNGYCCILFWRSFQAGIKETLEETMIGMSTRHLPRIFFLLRHTFPNIFFLLYWQWYPWKECYCMVEYQGTINIVKYNFVSRHSHGLYANKALLKCHLLICRGCTFADRPAIELGPWEFSQYLL